jgi:uncharacterized protein (TIGR03437 family)
MLGTAASAQIWNLSTTINGDDLYFASSLSQRGSGQPSTNKLFLLRNESLALIEQSPRPYGTGSYAYNRTALSAMGAVRAVNRILQCDGGSSCFFRELASTDIQTSSGTLRFDGNASLSANGRFAVLFGNTSQAPGSIRPKSARLVDLQSGQMALMGPQAAEEGQMVADDGTVLVARDGGIRLTGPGKSIDLIASRPMNRALLSADASRIVYDVQQSPFEIRVVDAATGVDRSFGPGSSPMLAADGQRFSYLNSSGLNSSGLNSTGGPTQIWLGDAVTGSSRPLSNEPEGIRDHAITGDGATVIAATNTGRLLYIDTSTGAAKQVLGSPGPLSRLLTAAVPGSYNEIVGSFPAGFVPEIRIGATVVPVLGPSPRGIAIQIPWYVQPDPTTSIILSAPETAWEQVLSTGVYAATGAVLPVGARGPGGPAYYAVHENWSGLVTTENPARPGEVIHLYGTGYGPVDGTIATGQPTPTDRLYRMISPCTWQAIGVLNDPRPFEVLFAGLAPGLVGTYHSRY